MKDWHRSDVFDAPTERGWEGPQRVEVSLDEASYVAEAYTFRRQGEDLRQYFVADFGIGFKGPDSVEAVVAKPHGQELWLNRTREAKWRRELMFWANRLSGLAVPEIREPNLPPTV